MTTLTRASMKPSRVPGEGVFVSGTLAPTRALSPRGQRAPGAGREILRWLP
jgi:hypothetical protein